MNKLFVYGTLKQARVQQKVFGRTATVMPDILPDFNKDVVEISGNNYPIAIRKRGESISGGVIEVTDEELELIDEYETAAYDRIRSELASGSHSWVYAKPEPRHN